MTAPAPIQPSAGTQSARLLAELLTGRRVDPLYAWMRLGIYRLSDVVFKLRRAGWQVHTSVKTVSNRFGERCDVAAYHLTHKHEG